MLWFVYQLEKQAEKSGGKVHFLLGNHEYMVLQKDLRYLHKKYNLASQLLNTPYDELYGVNTVLGRWLRSKATLIKINENTCRDKQKKSIMNIYTNVLKGHIAVAQTNLNKINTGKKIDIRARKFLKKDGLDYAHGTGHGVGFFLNVHEGPQSISKFNSI